MAPSSNSRFNEALERVTAAVLEAMPHLKQFNAHVAAWVSEASWKRLAVMSVLVLLTTSIIGSILGVEEATVVHTGNTGPVKVDITEDDNQITLHPTVGGKPSKPIVVTLPKLAPLPSQKDGTRGMPSAPKAPSAPDEPAFDLDSKDGLTIEQNGKHIVIDGRGVHVRSTEGAAAPSEPSAANPNASRESPEAESGAGAGHSPETEVRSDKSRAEAAKAAAQAQKEAQEAAEEAHAARIEEIHSAVEDAKDDLEAAVNQAVNANGKTVVRREGAFFWDFFKVILTLGFAYVIALKLASRTKLRADAMVKSASEVADRESLQRQVLEARMQMMQAQVEPHFLFNTLASVDYLIETDPVRASMMQKNLIQYLRAALPQMRENVTNLGREADLVGAFLEILKVRMEERLRVTISIPDGLKSSDFPPMMLQSLVENAIKHGLEPKPEGGAISVSAEIVDGDLLVTVADTGLGFSPGNAATAGGGLGLTNIRERLALLYGTRGRLVIAADVPVGTRATIIVPYQPTARKADPNKSGEKT